ncbi:hypothetical protein D0327_RS14395 [Enterococcus hirae]
MKRKNFFNIFLSSLIKVNYKVSGANPKKLHALKYSHIAFFIEQNIQLLIIQERLRYATIQITLKTYGNLYAKSDRKVIQLIDHV